jgi:hypothetical protein
MKSEKLYTLLLLHSIQNYIKTSPSWESNLYPLKATTLPTEVKEISPRYQRVIPEWPDLTLLHPIHRPKA